MWNAQCHVDQLEVEGKRWNSRVHGFILSYEFTRFSAAEDNEYIASLEAQYDDQSVGFLTYGYNLRKKVSLLYSVLLRKSIYCDVEFSSMKTSGLPYNRDEFGEIKLNLRYNIAK